MATQLSTMITGYYSQVVGGDLTKTWPLLTSDYQQNTARGFANYQKFWQGMQKVTCTDVVATAPDTVTATIGYFPKDGAATQERTRFTLLQEGGVWKIAHSVVVG